MEDGTQDFDNHIVVCAEIEEDSQENNSNDPSFKSDGSNQNEDVVMNDQEQDEINQKQSKIENNELTKTYQTKFAPK